MDETLLCDDAPTSYPPLWVEGQTGLEVRWSVWHARCRVAINLIMVLGAAVLVASYDLHATPAASGIEFCQQRPLQLSTRVVLSIILFVFYIVLASTSRRWMCPPAAKYNNRRDQGYTLQAFLTSSVPVASALFLLRAADAPRGIALVAFSLVVSSLSLRRLVHRILLHHNFRQKPRVRNLLIVGTGEKERRLMAHIRRWTKGAMTVKGLVDDTGSEWWSPSKSIDIVCQVDTLFEDAKRLAVDEIYFIAPVDPQLVQIVTPQARIHGVGLRVVPKLCVELDSRTGAQMNAEGGVYECTWPACTICDR